ncbi:MAG: CopG family antitoxin [Caldilinea sp.]
MSDTINTRDEIPEEFASLAEAGAFWDTHDSGDYEDCMTPVGIELDTLEHKVYVAVARDVAVQLQAKARDQGVGTETLVNLWLLEKLLQHQGMSSS